MKKLYKTTIEIWSEEPTDNLEIDRIASEAMDGQFICDKQECVGVDISQVPAGVLDFFEVTWSPFGRDARSNQITDEDVKLLERLEKEAVPYTAADIRVIPDDPSPCHYCGRPKGTSKTPFNAEGVCWRKDSMEKNNISVLECAWIALGKKFP